MDDGAESRKSDRKQSLTNVRDTTLWKDLRIKFRLEAFKFPDNKIYGTVHISPPTSRKMIDKFQLFINNQRRAEFDPSYEEISIAGFNIKEKDYTAHIKAVPKSIIWEEQGEKISDVCKFVFTGKIFALSPTVTVGTTHACVEWRHIGDDHIHQYILYLDGQLIYRIDPNYIHDEFKVKITNLKPKDQHILQLVALVKNYKEAYRSDPIEFTIPDKESVENKDIESIVVFNESAPHNLPVVVGSASPKSSDVDQPSKDSNAKTYRCCDLSPHDKFPGFEHYFHVNRYDETNKRH